MEMPVDVLTHRLGKMVDYGVNIPDPTATAIDIDQELQEKFYFIPKEEVDAVPIEDTSRTNIHTSLQAGSGPETIRANPDDNPSWLYNSAVHALAMMQHLKLEQERPRIPEPGVYLLHGGTTPVTVIVTEDRRVVVNQFGTAEMKDQTDLIRRKADTYTFQRIDLATGDLSA